MAPSGHVIVRLRPGSDGDATHIPPPGVFTAVNPPALYLEKTAQQWMERRGDARPGVKYILEGLPAGYTMWQRPRPGDTKHVDKYLFGHPDHKRFDSPNRFYPHFEYLMENGGSNIGCPCTVCAGTAGVLPKSTANSTRVRSSSTASSTRPPTPRSQQLQTSQAPRAPNTTVPVAPITVAPPPIKGRPKLTSAGLDTARVDEEGTPDVYRNLVDKLRRNNAIDEVIEEPLSPDWRAEQEMLPSLLQSLKEKEQWVPRNGDIVLYVRDLPDGVDFVRHEVTGEYQLYDERSEEFLGSPVWEAGLIGQTPTEVTTIADLVENSESNVIYSGVRVEPIPDPNDSDKSLSKRYKYVSLRQTRPFVFWKELLHQVPREEWHPTIGHALTVTSTISLMGKHRFRGVWPTANIYCHALYLGFEMLTVGDTIRLLPSTKSGQAACSEIMIVKSIRLKWSNLDKASNNDYDEDRPYNSEIWLYGSAYTSDQSRSNKQWLSDQNLEPSKAAAGYAEWYPLHPSTKELAIAYSRVLGRLYERDAVAFLLNSDDDLPDLDAGREGLLDAREYSRKHDQRITQDLNATWYWGDSRADTLNLQTINGLEVAKFDQERDVRDWRKKIKLMEGMTNEKAPTNVKPSAADTGLGGKNLRSFMAPGTTSLPVRTNASQETSVSGSAAGAAGPSKKRHHIIDLSDEEDDEEIRQYTRLVEDEPARGKKKAKVMVVID